MPRSGRDNRRASRPRPPATATRPGRWRSRRKRVERAPRKRVGCLARVIAPLAESDMACGSLAHTRRGCTLFRAPSALATLPLVSENHGMQLIEELAEWVAGSAGPGEVRLTALPAEASTRQFFRVSTTRGRAGAAALTIAMVAPPETEDNQRFVGLARRFRCHGLATPEIPRRRLRPRLRADGGILARWISPRLTARVTSIGR